MLDVATQLLKQGKAQQALPLLAEHCAGNPRDPSGWFLLGACQHQLNLLPQSLQSLEHALAIEPGHIQSRVAQGVVLNIMGRAPEALQAFRSALQLAPTDAQLLLNTAILLEQAGDLHAALEYYDLTLSHHPAHAGALLNRGSLLLRLKRLQDAVANNRKLVELQPRWEYAHFNLGEALLAAGQWADALAAYECTLALNPHASKATFGKGLALAMLKRFDASQQAFDHIRHSDPASYASSLEQAATLTAGELREFTPRTIYLLCESARLGNCDWKNLEDFSANFAALIADPPPAANEMSEPALLFCTFVLPIPAASSLQLASRIAQRLAEKVAHYPVFSRAPKLAGKIRIGYVSPDFRNHPTARLTRHLYALHDRSLFEVYGYSLHQDDGSSLRREIEQGCDVFRELGDLSDRAAAETIHRDEIDILIDLAGYTTHARPEIFSMRPAPLQVSYLGFPHSTGADFIDYFIADSVVVPPGSERFFSERLCYLPDSYFLFDNKQSISDSVLTRTAFGLPEQGFVYCCFNNNSKISPHDFEVWMNILQRVPHSVLWLLGSTPAAAENLHREAAARGINAERLIFASFLPNDQHLARYRLADLFLDTRCCNAHTTAAEALWAGLPVLTCPGETMASRVASSLLHAVSLDEMICSSPQQYAERACQLAEQPDEMARIKMLLAENRLTTALFDSERQVQKIESAYLAIWQRHEFRLPPETLHIAA